MTYKKLSQLIGVSPATVSKVLSGSGEISLETAELVKKAAREYGVVRPKYHREHKPKRVIVIVPEIVSVYYSNMATLIADHLYSRGFEASIMICGFDNERYFDIIDLIENEKYADGIISLTAHPLPDRRDIPIVALDSSKDSHCDTVSFNVESGINDAVKHLAALGHRNIGYIGEKYTNAKLEYFKKALEQNQLEFNERNIFVSYQRFEMIGVEGAEHFVRMRNRPTAFIAAYDEVAVGAIHTFMGHGIKIPENVSIIGINDIPSSAYAKIPLTTVKTFSNDMVSVASDLLINRINDGSRAIQKVTLCCELVIRETTAECKMGR